MSPQSYFANMALQQRRLQLHGFDHYPSEEELFDYVIDLNDKVNALYWALGMKSVRDSRGTWHAFPIQKEVS